MLLLLFCVVAVAVVLYCAVAVVASVAVVATGADVDVTHSCCTEFVLLPFAWLLLLMFVPRLSLLLFNSNSNDDDSKYG